MTDVWTPERLASGRRAWRLNLVGTLISALGSGLTLPFLIVYLHGVRHVSLPVAGLVVGFAALTALAITPLAGVLGDRIGLGRLLVSGLLTCAVGTGLIAVAARAWEAAGAVALNSIGAALLWPALNGLVASQLPPHERSHGYAVRYGVLNAGLGVGGLISGWIVSVHHPGTFEAIYLVDAGSTLASVTVVYFGLRRSPGYLPTGDLPPPDEGGGESKGGYRAVLRDRAFLGFLGCTLLFGVFGYAQLDGPWAAFVTLVVHASPRVVGIGFAVNTATIVLSQIGVSRLTRRWRRSRLLGMAGGLWTLAWVISSLARIPALSGWPADVALATSLGVFGLGETFQSPVSGGMPNELSPEHLRARYNALSSATWPVGSLIGPPLAGLLLSSSARSYWGLVIAAGTAMGAGVGILLGRVLPASVDHPPQEPTGS
jgi:MFS family permease